MEAPVLSITAGRRRVAGLVPFLRDAKTWSSRKNPKNKSASSGTPNTQTSQPALELL
jgi:hypothetical protein